MNFDDAFTKLLGHEGGYVNDARDPGGKTRYGITETVARLAGYRGDMQALPLDLARRIYLEEYWRPAGGEAVPDAAKFQVFDMAVNSGVGAAVKTTQRALGVAEDGVLGPQTLAALQAADPARFVARFNGARLAFLAGLHHPRQ
jgi:lysozyme family protein